MGKVIKKIAKIALPLAAAAAPFIPGVGPLGSALIGAGAQAGEGLLNKPKAPKQPQIVINQQRYDPGTAEAVEAAHADEFKPTRPEEIARPTSLNELAGFTGEQERTALATQGINVGLGSQESDYYKNLLQRSLISPGGQVGGDQNFLAPIEQQYFRRQGANVGSPMDFLRSIRA